MLPVAMRGVLLFALSAPVRPGFVG